MGSGPCITGAPASGHGRAAPDHRAREGGAGPQHTHLAATPHREQRRMNKTDLIDAVASDAEVTKAEAARAVDAVIDSITKALKKGEAVTLVGFGTFQVRKRAARTGRNPKTGETIKIKASKNPAFKAGKALKDAVN
ncbi:HU family DNA-binding protein [Pseudoxanthomonas suwonensis]|uniref:HU family DNA-binding protein n=1 Tax=Pseudoxanthomonas suwonensis TaxID=314722 RepID=UPI0022AFB9D2|nr:HU family DNA-binding protein [Pseudoxanthomonas suwonensis]